MGTISQEDVLVVRALKQRGVLLKFDPKELNGSSKNGGVAVICSDGDIDAPFFHAQISHRPHCVRIFGGSLLFASSFLGFKRHFACDIKANIRAGMEVKETKTLFLYVHAPCGVATQYEIGIEAQIALAAEAREFFIRDHFFVLEKIHALFHVKKMVEGRLEQNTYRIVICS